MRLRPQSVRAQLTVWYTVILGTPLIAFSIVAYITLASSLQARTDRFLAEALDAFTTELHAEAEELPTVDDAVQAALDEVLFRDTRFLVIRNASDSSYSLTDLARAPWEGASLRAAAPRIAEVLRQGPPTAAGPDTIFTLSGRAGGRRIRARATQVDGEPLVVAAIYPQEGLVEALHSFRTLELAAIPLLIVIAALGGYFLAGRSLSPVAAMARRAAEIGAANLHERLPVENPRDELGGLATVVNGLLDRLERSFQQQRRFMADASHELRTPVAVMRAESEIALSRASRPESEYRESLAVVEDASGRLSRIVNDLFLLARADAGHHPVRWEDVDLDELVADAARALRGLAERRGVRIEVSSPPEAPFRGDPELLGRLLLNLMDNAIKYSRPGAAARVVLTRTADVYEIAVADAGPGIAPEARPHIFERFYREDRVRSRTEDSETSGAGLGLSIALWIARAHGGRIELARSDATGSEFRVTLPIAHTPATPDEHRALARALPHSNG